MTIRLRPKRKTTKMIEVEEPIPLDEAVKLALVDRGYKLIRFDNANSRYVIKVTFGRGGTTEEHVIEAWTDIDKGHGGDREDWIYDSFLWVLETWEKNPVEGNVPGGKVVKA